MSKKKGLTEEQKRKNLVTKISEMTPEELRIKCAEKMGWKVIKDVSKFATHHIQKPDGSFLWSWICYAETEDNINKVKLFYYPDYATDRNALQTLIEAVPEDKRTEFILNIENILFDRRLPAIMAVWIYKMLIAPPLAIMRAFLEVMK